MKKSAENLATMPRRNGSRKLSKRSRADSQNALSKPRRENKLEQSLRALGVTTEQLATAPPLSATIRESIGSIDKAIQAMRFSGNPVVIAFLHIYDQASGQAREQLPLEAFALKAAVNINELLGATLIAFKELQSQKSALRVMDEHPELVRKSIQYAKLKSGASDRRMIHEAVGFLPTPRGASMNLNLNLPGAKPAPPPNDPGGQEPPEIGEVFPPITNDLEPWQEQRGKLLKENN